MDDDQHFVKSLGSSTSIPGNGSDSSLCGSIAVSSVGDLLVLSGEGRVFFASVRQPQQSPVELRLEAEGEGGAEGADRASFRHIAVSRDGGLLLLWSARCVAVAEIPAAWLSQGSLQPLSAGKAVSLRTVLAAEEGCEIVQVSFHPQCAHCAVALQSQRTLSLLDLRDDRLSQKIALPANHTFNAFAFGPDLEWLRFSLFLTTAQQQVFYLCPVIPRGAAVAHEVVEELWSWFDTQSQRLQDRKKSHKNTAIKEEELLSAHLEKTRSYLLHTVGHVRGAEEHSLCVFAGELSSHSLESKSAEVTFYDLALQGPLDLHKRKYKDNENEQDSICDILMPFSNRGDRAAPVFVVAYSSGQIDLLLLDAMDASLWFVHPGWKEIDQPPVSQGENPRLLVADSFLLPKSPAQNTQQRWKLFANDVHPHEFFCVNPYTAEAYSLSSVWLQKALRAVSRALSEGHSQDVDIDSEAVSQTLPLYLAEPQQRLSGFCVTNDPFAGHLALLRMASNDWVAMNLTMHAKLCEMKGFLKDADADELSGDEALRRDFRSLTADDTLRWRHAEKIIAKIAAGLRELPELEVTVHSASDPVAPESEAQRKKMLIEAAGKLEQNVLQHINELYEATAFHMKLVEQMYEVQKEIIEGQDSCDPNSRDISAGLKNLIKNLLEENLQIVKQLETIEDKYNELREKGDKALEKIFAQQRKLSAAEMSYHSELKTWADKVNKMKRDVAALLQSSSESKFVPTNHRLRPPPKTSEPFTPSASRVMGTPSRADISVADLSTSTINLSLNKFMLAPTPSKGDLLSSFTPQRIAKKNDAKSLVSSITPSLSEAEEKSCMDALKSQADLIQAAERKVEDLQRKIAAAKAAQQHT